jgi:hypothetical protein
MLGVQRRLPRLNFGHNFSQIVLLEINEFVRIYLKIENVLGQSKFKYLIHPC